MSSECTCDTLLKNGVIVICERDPECPDHGDPISEYQRGYLTGLRAYAWWADGVEYVGTCGQTYKDAAALFLENESNKAKP